MIQFDSLSAFLAMGGYAAYVWSGFGVTLLCLAILAGHTLYVRRRLRTEALRQMARFERIQRARAEKAAARSPADGG